MPGYEIIGSEEKKEINKIFQTGGVLFRQGFEKIRKRYFVKDFENLFAKNIGTKHCLAVTSGTSALRVALAALKLKPGDEVITQSFTFVATVEAIIEARLQPICCDIDNTLNICPIDLKKKISKKTKAVILVHMLGISPEMDEIMKICKKKNISIIEDTAWGCGGVYGNKKLGTIGRMGTYSFDFAKSMTTGEGGMISFNNKKDYLYAKAWHDHGHENNPRVPRWEDTRKSSGFNYRMTELQAAVGIAQLKKLKKILKLQRLNKKKIWNKIKKLDIVHRKIPKKNNDTCDALIFFTKSKKISLKCKRFLNKNGIYTKILPEALTWHFAKYWRHMPELKKKHKNLSKSFLVSEKILSRAVSIPISIKMKKNFPKLVYRSLLKALA